jgi:hypothetical protein
MRRQITVFLIAALSMLTFGAASAGATVLHHYFWDISLEGKQSMKWSFAAERPEECTSYYGSASSKAQGFGSDSMTFATKKKMPIYAETSLMGGKLRFSSFATEGFQAPATFTKQGNFSVTYGMPCGSRADDPAPLPAISDDSGCGTEKGKLRPSLDWAKGELVLQGSLDIYPHPCPGPFEPLMNADSEGPCTSKNPKSYFDETSLPEIPIDVPTSEFTKGKVFTATANHKFRCEFPSTWPGKAPVKLELSTKYELTFHPKTHF